MFYAYDKVISLQTLAQFFLVLPSMLHILDFAIASIGTIAIQSGWDQGCSGPTGVVFDLLHCAFDAVASLKQPVSGRAIFHEPRFKNAILYHFSK